MKRRALLFILAGLPAALAQDQDARPGEPPRWQVRVELLFARLPQRAALPLVPKLRTPRETEAAVATLRRYLAQGEATLLAAPVLWTEDQNRVVSETNEEFRYKTEFVLHSVPQNFGESVAVVPQESDADWAIRHNRYQFMDVPVAFETRNLGVTVELEPVVWHGGQAIAINLVTQHVTFEGLFSRPPVSAQAARWRYEQPQFRTHKTTTTLDVPSGRWFLSSVFLRPGADPQVEIGLLRATAFPLRP